MEGKEKLIEQLKNLRKNEFYNRFVKFILLAVFVILIPILIYDKIQERDFMTAIVILIAELFFIGIAIMLLKSAMEFYKIKNSRIYQCIDNPEAVTEIVLTPNKIVFELKGMEDETIFLKQSEYRSKIIANIKKVFGETKIVSNY